MKLKIIAIITSVVICLTVACVPLPEVSGKVIDKLHEPDTQSVSPVFTGKTSGIVLTGKAASWTVVIRTSNGTVLDVDCNETFYYSVAINDTVLADAPYGVYHPVALLK